MSVLHGRIRPAMFHADLHIHSKFSRACSKDCDIEHLSWWALRKGLRVLGTGDFTHPAWAAELRETLVPAEPGLFRIRPDLERRLGRDTPASCAGTVRFMLSVEISTIYRRDDRTRKVHHLLYAPGFDEADRITAALARIGNLASDGRPILGLDSRDLWTSRCRPARAAPWCARTCGRRGSPCSARSPASTRWGTAAPTWRITSSGWRPACPRTRR